MTNDNNTATTTQTEGDGSSLGGHSIFRVVSDIIGKRAKDTYYNMHCEVALASLVAACKHPDLKVSHYVDNEVIVELAVGLICFLV